MAAGYKAPTAYPSVMISTSSIKHQGHGNLLVINDGMVSPGAGFGVRHSELNNLLDRSTRFLQIWVKPKFKGIRPSYGQKHFDREQRQGLKYGKGIYVFVSPPVSSLTRSHELYHMPASP